MTVNIFFCNGFMSVLSSCFIADYLYKQNPQAVFVLCIEQNGHVEPVYYQALDILVAQNKSFIKVIRTNVDFKSMSLRSPIAYFQSVAYYKKIAIDVFNQLGVEIQNNISTVWASTTSRLWPFFRRGGVEFNLIEHGIGEYIFARTLKKVTVKSRVLKLIGLGFGYCTVVNFDSIWLCSNAVKFSSDVKIVQHNFTSQFSEYVNNFWSQYQKTFPIAAQELRFVASQTEKNGSISYLYLPSDEIRYELYAQFINDQITALGFKKSSALFIIKNHPGDTLSDYTRHLASYGTCFVISELVNCYLPVEFVATILNVKNVVGSCSSALFYLKSWQPDIVIHIYNDFDEQLLKLECARLKKSLDSVGLINKQFN